MEIRVYVIIITGVVYKNTNVIIHGKPKRLCIFLLSFLLFLGITRIEWIFWPAGNISAVVLLWHRDAKSYRNRVSTANTEPICLAPRLSSKGLRTL